MLSRSTNTHIRPPPAPMVPALGLKKFSFGCAHTSSADPVTTLEPSSPSLCAAEAPSLGHAHFLTRGSHAPQTPAPPKARSPEAPPSRAPETPQRMPGRDRDVRRASLVWVAVFARSRSRVAAVSWCVAVAVPVSLPARAAPCTTAAARSGTGPLRARSSWRACGPTPTANSSAKRWLTGR